MDFLYFIIENAIFSQLPSPKVIMMFRLSPVSAIAPRMEYHSLVVDSILKQISELPLSKCSEVKKQRAEAIIDNMAEVYGDRCLLFAGDIYGELFEPLNEDKVPYSNIKRLNKLQEKTFSKLLKKTLKICKRSDNPIQDAMFSDKFD